MKLFSWLIKKSIIALAVLLVIFYLVVPFIANLVVDKESLNSKFSTHILESDQPKRVRLSEEERWLHRAMNMDSYLSILLSSIWHFPMIVVDYALLPNSRPKVKNSSFGMFVDASKAPIENILNSLEDLNITSTAIRIYITEDYIMSREYNENLKLASRLKSRGYSVMLVLAQLNESFSLNLPILLNRVVNDFGNYVDYYQSGEAVNRDKWGILNRDMFSTYLMSVYKAVSLNDPEAKILGPAVIDFEWYYTVYYLNLAEELIDIHSSLLYVDRVGEPENSQYGFDTVGKVRLLKAISPDKPLWITEVNWPIKGTGRYRPTSEREAVSPETYRDYMLRYLVEVLADGTVERVYWWQLFAKGYGIIDHTTRKKSSAFWSYKRLVALLSDAKVVKREIEDETYKYTFKKGENIFTMMWNRGEKVSKLPEVLNCISFDNTVGKNIVAVASTPVVCGDRLSMDYIKRVMR